MTAKRRNDMILTIIILSVILLAAIIWAVFATIGMFKGLKKTEQYESTLENIRKRIFNAYTQMKEIDTLGAFEADDDVGIIFTELKELVNELQNYIDEETQSENTNE
jgi:cell division protein FtsB